MIICRAHCSNNAGGHCGIRTTSTQIDAQGRCMFYHMGPEMKIFAVKYKGDAEELKKICKTHEVKIITANDEELIIKDWDDENSLFNALDSEFSDIGLGISKGCIISIKEVK